MFIRKKIWFLSSAVFIISAVGFYMVYMNLLPSVDLRKSESKGIVEEYVNNNLNNTVGEVNQNIGQMPEGVPTAQANAPRITRSTQMVYQYYYEEDGKIVEETIEPPYFLIDLTRDELQEKYSDWQISYFSDQKVIMKKNIASKSPYHFVVGVYNGYIAIFYNNEEGELEIKEITETPISSLPIEEQNKLKEGIKVYGEEALIRILQDYTS
ncbi:BofC C-terminal domain-containing protein [Defluviitalea saccharophila]|uniref:BofC C-terminal domain-containing protein n=1 Tax=Defluviitalea saccharophila TaxID=879970 RepID=A0ABZ2Y535_9FIRM